MRFVLRATLALFVLLVIAFGALLYFLPRLAETEAVRARLAAAARDATGRDVAYDDLAMGLFPPRLVVVRPRVAAADPASPPLLEADRIGLRLTLLPLLVGSLVVDQVLLEGATLRLERGGDGVALPGGPIDAEPPADGEVPVAEPPSGAGLAVAVREARLTGARILLTDRTLSPAVTWELIDLEASARVDSLDTAIPFEVSGTLKSGGALHAEGSATLAGAVDAEARLERVSLRAAAPYAGPETSLAGLLDGTLRIALDEAGTAKLSADLEVGDTVFTRGDLRLRGRVGVRAELDGPFDALAGSFDLDATQADLAFGEGVKKPVGTTATASGRIVSQPDGSFAIEGVRLKIKNLDARVRAQLGPKPRVEISAAPFETEGWEALIAALEGTKVGGPVAIEALAVSLDPLDVRGAVSLDGVRAVLEGVGPVGVRGRVEGVGGGLRFRDFALSLAGQTLSLDGELAGLAGTPRLSVRARARAADSNALLAAFADVRDTLYGPLDLDANLKLPLGADTDPLQALSGELRFGIACPPPADPGDCRLRGVSMLRSTFDRLGSFGGIALAAGEAGGGRSMQRFYGDEFRSIGGTVSIAQGRARSNDLTLVYRGYTVELRGTVGLVDGKLDATGKLTIEEEVDAALAETEGRAPSRRPKVIPLARVTGTLASPRVDLSREAVVAFSSSYARERYGGEIREEIDEVLGDGAGDEILDALEGLFGGGKR